MAKEIPTPLAMQMRHTSSMGLSGLNISEHQGESGLWYEEGSEVETGILKLTGGWAHQDPALSAIHKDETLSHYTKDGVSVELIAKQVSEQELIDAEMNNDEF